MRSLVKRKMEGSPVESPAALPEVSGFTVDELLGEGTFAKVYHATCLQTGKEYALKHFPRLLSRAAAQALEYEVTVHFPLKHPTIVRCLGFVEVPESYNIVLEFGEGVPLNEKRWDFGGLFPEKKAAQIIFELADALSYLGSHNIIFRALSARTVMYTPDGHVKLYDLGLALQSNCKQTDVAGTALVMAPEVLRLRYEKEKKNQGAGYHCEVDWWGLGIMAYFLLTGDWPYDSFVAKLPTNDAQQEAVYGQLINNKPTQHLASNKVIPDGAKKLILGLLVDAPGKRFKFTEIQENQWIQSQSVFFSEFAVFEQGSTSDWEVDFRGKPWRRLDITGNMPAPDAKPAAESDTKSAEQEEASTQSTGTSETKTGGDNKSTLASTGPVTSNQTLLPREDSSDAEYGSSEEEDLCSK